MIVFLIARGVVHKKLLTQEQSVNDIYYVDVLERLRTRFNSVQKNIVATYVLDQDNTLSHTSLCAHKFLAKYKVTMLL